MSNSNASVEEAELNYCLQGLRNRGGGAMGHVPPTFLKVKKVPFFLG